MKKINFKKICICGHADFEHIEEKCQSKNPDNHEDHQNFVINMIPCHCDNFETLYDVEELLKK